MLTAKQRITTLSALNAEDDIWWQHVKTIGIRDYRRGWYAAAAGSLLCDCDSPAMEAGWWASQAADPAMRRIGVRA